VQGGHENNDEEVCPSCGSFVDYLLIETGFCEECSLTYGFVTEVGGTRCRRCKARPVDDSTHRICRVCRHEEWLGKNADAIDRYLAGNGLRIGRAIKAVRQQNSIICRRCGALMKKATRGTAYFCNKPQCRTAQNKLRRLIYVKRIPRAQALEIVLEELDASNQSTYPQAEVR